MSDAGVVKVHIEGDLGEVDVFPTPNVACVFVQERDVINLPPSLREQLSRLVQVI